MKFKASKELAEKYDLKEGQEIEILKEKKLSDADVDNLATEISKFTQNNAHTESIKYLVDKLGWKKYSNILDSILNIQKYEGYLPSGVSDYRYNLLQEVLDLLKRDLTFDQFEKIRMSF
jgi:hypothetical protein